MREREGAARITFVTFSFFNSTWDGQHREPLGWSIFSTLPSTGAVATIAAVDRLSLTLTGRRPTSVRISKRYGIYGRLTVSLRFDPNSLMVGHHFLFSAF
jgi:hypothetical protein